MNDGAPLLHPFSQRQWEIGWMPNCIINRSVEAIEKIWIFGNRSKANDKNPLAQKPSGQKPPDNKPPRIIEEIIAKYAVDANLFQLGSTNPKKKKSRLFFFFSFILGGLLSRWLLPGVFWPRTKKGIAVS